MTRTAFSLMLGLALSLTACADSTSYRNALTGEACEPDPQTMVAAEGSSQGLTGDDHCLTGDCDDHCLTGDCDDHCLTGDCEDDGDSGDGDDGDYCFEPPEPGGDEPEPGDGDGSGPIELTGGGDCLTGDCDDECLTGDCDDDGGDGPCLTGDDCEEPCLTGDDCEEPCLTGDDCDDGGGDDGDDGDGDDDGGEDSCEIPPGCDANGCCEVPEPEAGDDGSDGGDDGGDDGDDPIIE